MSQVTHLNTVGRLLSCFLLEARTGLASCVCRLGGPSHAPPHAPELTGKAVIVLTAFGQPGADAVLSTAHLDHPRQLGMIGRTPVKPIAAEVDEPPALVLVRGISLEHALRGVFRVRTRYHAAIGG